jgi:hypothetical protein
MFLALLRREIEDYGFCFLGSLITGLCFALMIWLLRPEVTPEYTDVYAILLGALPVFAIGAGICGAAQMFNDRRTGMLTFLATLHSTWIHILVAKWIAGVLCILVGLLPIIVAAYGVFSRWTRLFPLDLTLLHHSLLCIFWAAMAGYALGARLILKERKVAILVGILAALALLFSIVLIKGITLATQIWFLVLAIAGLTELAYRLRERAW